MRVASPECTPAFSTCSAMASAPGITYKVNWQKLLEKMWTAKILSANLSVVCHSIDVNLAPTFDKFRNHNWVLGRYLREVRQKSVKCKISEDKQTRRCFIVLLSNDKTRYLGRVLEVRHQLAGVVSDLAQRHD